MKELNAFSTEFRRFFDSSLNNVLSETFFQIIL